MDNTVCQKKTPCVVAGTGAIATDLYCDASSQCVDAEGTVADPSYASCVSTLGGSNLNETIVSYDFTPLTDLAVIRLSSGTISAIDMTQGGVPPVYSGAPDPPTDASQVETVFCLLTTCLLTRTYPNGSLVMLHDIFPATGSMVNTFINKNEDQKCAHE